MELKRPTLFPLLNGYLLTTLLCFQGWRRGSVGNFLFMCNWTLKRRNNFKWKMMHSSLFALILICSTFTFSANCVCVNMAVLFSSRGASVNKAGYIRLHSMQERGCRNTCTDHVLAIFFPLLSYCTHSSSCHDATLLVLLLCLPAKGHEVSIKCICCLSAASSPLSIILWWFRATNQEAIGKFVLWTLWVWQNLVVVLFLMSHVTTCHCK